MKLSSIFQTIAIFFAVTLPSLASAAGIPPADLVFPDMDVHAPPLDVWTRTFLNASVPNLPVNTVKIPYPVWTKDYTQCVDGNAWSMTFDDGPR